MQVIRSFVREVVQAYKQKDKNAICDLISLDSASERVEQLSQVLYDVSNNLFFQLLEARLLWTKKSIADQISITLATYQHDQLTRA
jgi:hypothetical protein